MLMCPPDCWLLHSDKSPSHPAPHQILSAFFKIKLIEYCLVIIILILTVHKPVCVSPGLLVMMRAIYQLHRVLVPNHLNTKDVLLPIKYIRGQY